MVLFQEQLCVPRGSKRVVKSVRCNKLSPYHWATNLGAPDNPVPLDQINQPNGARKFQMPVIVTIFSSPGIRIYIKNLEKRF